MHASKLSKQRNQLYSFVIIFAIIIIIGSGIVLIEANYRQQQFNELQTAQLRTIKLGSELVGKEYNIVLADLNYFGNILGHLHIQQSDGQEITDQWITLVSQRKIYDSILLVDENGDELIKVEKATGGAIVTPAKHHQNINTTDLFKHAIKLSKGDIYVSNLTLANENGMIIAPHKPLIKFSTPIYDANKQLQGVLIIEYLAAELLNNVQQFATNLKGEVSLLNNEGFWLYNPDITKQWGFILKERQDQNFKNQQSAVWKAMTRKRSQMLTPQGLYTFTSLDLKAKLSEANQVSSAIYMEESTWYLVAFIERDNSKQADFVDQWQPLLLDIMADKAGELTALLTISIVIGYLLYLYQQTYSRLEYFSTYDAMTKVYNRYAGFRELNKLLNSDDKRKMEISVCFVDIDDLKVINDKFGHDTGDELIISTIEIIKTQIRSEDFIVKMGGDEFLIIFKGISEGQAEMIWQRINQEFISYSLEMQLPYVISASHGISTTWTGIKTDAEIIVKAADQKMYTNKKIKDDKA